MTDVPLANKDEIVQHIQYALEDIKYFISGVNRENHLIEDFIDNVHNLSAFLKVLDYSNVRPDFIKIVKEL